MKTDKEFDDVKMMREVHNKKHNEYKSNLQLRAQRLAKIRKK